MNANFYDKYTTDELLKEMDDCGEGHKLTHAAAKRIRAAEELIFSHKALVEHHKDHHTKEAAAEELARAAHDALDLARTGMVPTAFSMTPDAWNAHKVVKIAATLAAALEKYKEEG